MLYIAERGFIANKTKTLDIAIVIPICNLRDSIKYLTGNINNTNMEDTCIKEAIIPHTKKYIDFLFSFSNKKLYAYNMTLTAAICLAAEREKKYKFNKT